MSMVFFFSDDGDTKVCLDSETSITVDMPSSVSKSSVMSGSSVSDEVIEGNIIITVQGVVTYGKNASQKDNLNPSEFGDEIQSARRNRRKFTLFVKDYDQPLLKDYTDCVIAGASIVVDKYSDSITVMLRFEQVFVSSSATQTTLAPLLQESAKPTASDVVNKGDAQKETITSEVSTSMLKDITNLAESVSSSLVSALTSTGETE